MIINIPSETTNQIYQVDLVHKTCTCPAFKFNVEGSKTCKHLERAKAIYPQFFDVSNEGLQPPSARADSGEPFKISKQQEQQIKDFEAYTRTRLSKHFIMRDFLYSTRAEILGIPNRPSDDPEMCLRAGKALCEKVLEPVIEKFGPMSITYGYQSRALIEAGYKKTSKHSSAPHQWDRGTFGKEIYARVDFLLYAIEDGEVSKFEVGRWMMSNLDIDLLMMWHNSNVLCVTISPKPRRVFLEWVPHGQGDNGSNKRTYMGEYYWQVVWPNLPEEKRPRFGPSCTGGKLYWKLP